MYQSSFRLRPSHPKNILKLSVKVFLWVVGLDDGLARRNRNYERITVYTSGLVWLKYGFEGGGRASRVMVSLSAGGFLPGNRRGEPTTPFFTNNDEASFLITPGVASAWCTMRGDGESSYELAVESSPLVAVQHDDAEGQTRGGEPGGTPEKGRPVMARCADFFGVVFVAITASPPGTVRLFRETRGAHGKWSHTPLTDIAGNELSLHVDDRLSWVSETQQSNPPKVVALEMGKGWDDESVLLFVATVSRARTFTISTHAKRPTAFVVYPHLSFDNAWTEHFVREPQTTHGPLVCVAIRDSRKLEDIDGDDQAAFPSRIRLAVAGQRAVTVCCVPGLTDSFHWNSWIACEKDGPVVSCAFLSDSSVTGVSFGVDDSATASVVLAVGFKKEIVLVKFALTLAMHEQNVQNEKHVPTVLRRILVHAPGPVRSVVTCFDALFVTTERSTELPTPFSFGGVAQPPVNFAFEHVSKYESVSGGAGFLGEELVESALNDDSRMHPDGVPYITANAKDVYSKHETLRSMVAPFLSPELKWTDETLDAIRGDTQQTPKFVCATVQSFVFDEKGTLNHVSLDLSNGTYQKPAIACAARGTSGLRVAVVDVGGRGAGLVSLVELGKHKMREIANAPLTGPSHTTKSPYDDTNTLCVECCVGTASDSISNFSVVALVSPRKTKLANSCSIFGGAAKEKPKLFLCSFRVEVTRGVELKEELITCIAEVLPPGIDRGGPKIQAVPSAAAKRPPALSEDALSRLANVGAVPGGTVKIDSDDKTVLGSNPYINSDSSSFARVLSAVQALNKSMHMRFDRIEQTLRRHERRLKNVEKQNTGASRE